MFIDLTDAQRTLQAELRTYFTELMTPEMKQKVARAEFAENPEYKALIRKIGADGWLGVGWPRVCGLRVGGLRPREFESRWAGELESWPRAVRKVRAAACEADVLGI